MPDTPQNAAKTRRNSGRYNATVSDMVNYVDPNVTVAHPYHYQSLTDCLRGFRQGLFQEAGRLWDVVSADPEISSHISTRFESTLGAFSLDHSEILSEPDDKEISARIHLKPEGESDEALRILFWWAENFGEIFNPETVSDLLRDEFGMGFAVAQIESLPGWKFRLNRWHPSLSYYDKEVRAYRVITQDVIETQFSARTQRGAVAIDPNGGQFILYTRNSDYLAWYRGAIIQLALPWLDKSFARRDWSQFTKIYGNPIRWINAPHLPSNKDNKSEIRSALTSMQNDGVCVVPSGWTAQLLSTPGTNADIFLKRIEDCNKAISLTVLGHDATTSNNGGRAAVETLIDSQQQGKTRSDVNAINGCFFPRIMRAITRLRFGSDVFAPTAKIVANNLTYKTRSSELNKPVQQSQPLNQVTTQQRPPTLEEPAQ